MDFKDEIIGYIDRLIDTLKKLDISEINMAMNVLENQYQRGGKIYVFGNGGSAATASHLACDFNKGISEGKKEKYNVVCLNDNVATITAIANDFSYEDIFSMQLEGRIKADDLVLAISGSGNSKNIIKAVKLAKKSDAIVIGVSGYNGGELKKCADYSMHVPIEDMQIVEDIHMIFNHMIMKIFCNNL